jgi:hypothetical protein
LRWNDAFTFYYNIDEGNIPTDYLANDKGWFVVSERLRALLDYMNVDCRYIRVPIAEARTKEPLEAYYVANILRTVDCLCLEASEYTTLTTAKRKEPFYSIKKYAVYESGLREIHVFKLANESEIPIFASQRFKDEIENNHFTGMDFQEIRTVG